MNVKFGDTLKELRIKNELTQDQLAKKLNVTRQTISSWERGKSLPDIEIISSIASMFNISINALLLNEITKVNKSLQKFKLIIWFISIILVSILSIYIYKDMYPAYKTNIKQYKQECSSEINEYDLEIYNDSYPPVDPNITGGQLINGYVITKEVEVKYEFGVYCVPIQFKFKNYTVDEAANMDRDVEVSAPHGFMVADKHTFVAYTDSTEEWYLVYNFDLIVNNQTKNGMEQYISEVSEFQKIYLGKFEKVEIFKTKTQ